MWSLFEQKDGKDIALPPLVFSNNKSQEDVVKEIIKAIAQGYKTIFIRGGCGTGKSAIALNLAKEIGKASIVVPVKNLQKQYEKDYTEKKFLLKANGERLKIKIITGRQNFPCPFLKDSPIKKQEGNSTLDIFGKAVEKFEEDNYNEKKDGTCNNSFLPCKIEIKEKNYNIIKQYLYKNQKLKKIPQLKDVRRMSIAPVCPFWSPIFPTSINLNLEDAEIREYLGLNNISYKFYRRRPGCGYYDQYLSYLDADVLIFNSLKYKIETTMNRKPKTEIEIIDEADEFLDSFSNYKTINLNRLYLSLGSLYADNENANKTIERVTNLTKELLEEGRIENKEILPINSTKVLELLEEFTENRLMDYVEADEENYCYHVEEVAFEFKDFFPETYITFEQDERQNFLVKIITTDLAKRFKELEDKNEVLVLMSGTLHSEAVLEDVFGLSNFTTIEAETKMPGKISFMRTGLEIDCKYENFKQGRITREQYLKALNKSILQSIKPALVHVNSFADLPSNYEKSLYKLDIMSREELEEQQKTEIGEQVRRFKAKEIPILYSTKCNRGVDFPGEQCNSIILTKFPFPDVNSLFWKLLKKTHPEYYNEFYVDKAKREFLQRIYRGLRSNQDHVYLLSPDIRVFQAKID